MVREGKRLLHEMNLFPTLLNARIEPKTFSDDCQQKPDYTFPAGETYIYDEETFASRVTVISVIAAVIMNVSSIYILYYVDNMQARLTAIMIYTPLFAIMMMILTDCQRAHIWPATAT